MNLKYFCIPLAGILLSGCEQTSNKTTKTSTPTEFNVNTGRVENDKNRPSVTPIQQNTQEKKVIVPLTNAPLESDRIITENIRKELSRTNFSTSAKNIKVFVIRGVVTLKGAVESETERVELGNIAKKIAGVNRVDNQLEVLQNK